MPTAKPPAELERDFARWLNDAAKMFGWRFAHFRPARTKYGSGPARRDPALPGARAVASFARGGPRQVPRAHARGGRAVKRQVYVASSWRNPHQQGVVAALREAGHAVYDFRNPAPGDHGFSWAEIDQGWQDWTPLSFRRALMHPRASSGFESDFGALCWADTVVLVLPSGRSSHLELGWAAGAGKRTAVMLAEGEPELMYLLADELLIGMSELLTWVCA
jgi:hypothetical protein